MFRNQNACVWDAALEQETIVLRDGCQLTYFLDGPLLERHALPHVFVFHAMFLSGNSFLMAEALQDYILVCVNRPGYFGLDPVGPDYTYDKFALDMEQLADHLNLDPRWRSFQQGTLQFGLCHTFSKACFHRWDTVR
jgi:hypothetical protein